MDGDDGSLLESELHRLREEFRRKERELVAQLLAKGKSCSLSISQCAAACDCTTGENGSSAVPLITPVKNNTRLSPIKVTPGARVVHDESAAADLVDSPASLTSTPRKTPRSASCRAIRPAAVDRSNDESSIQVTGDPHNSLVESSSLVTAKPNRRKRSNQPTKNRRLDSFAEDLAKKINRNKRRLNLSTVDDEQQIPSKLSSQQNLLPEKDFEALVDDLEELLEDDTFKVKAAMAELCSKLPEKPPKRRRRRGRHWNYEDSPSPPPSPRSPLAIDRNPDTPLLDAEDSRPTVEAALPHLLNNRRHSHISETPLEPSQSLVARVKNPEGDPDRPPPTIVFLQPTVAHSEVVVTGGSNGGVYATRFRPIVPRPQIPTPNNGPSTITISVPNCNFRRNIAPGAPVIESLRPSIVRTDDGRWTSLDTEVTPAGLTNTRRRQQRKSGSDDSDRSDRDISPEITSSARMAGVASGYCADDGTPIRSSMAVSAKSPTRRIAEDDSDDGLTLSELRRRKKQQQAAASQGSSGAGRFTSTSAKKAALLDTPGAEGRASRRQAQTCKPAIGRRRGAEDEDNTPVTSRGGTSWYRKRKLSPPFSVRKESVKVDATFSSTAFRRNSALRNRVAKDYSLFYRHPKEIKQDQRKQKYRATRETRARIPQPKKASEVEFRIYPDLEISQQEPEKRRSMKPGDVRRREARRVSRFRKQLKCPPNCHCHKDEEEEEPPRAKRRIVPTELVAGCDMDDMEEVRQSMNDINESFVNRALEQELAAAAAGSHSDTSSGAESDQETRHSPPDSHSPGETTGPGNHTLLEPTCGESAKTGTTHVENGISSDDDSEDEITLDSLKFATSNAKSESNRVTQNESSSSESDYILPPKQTRRPQSREKKTMPKKRVVIDSGSSSDSEDEPVMKPLPRSIRKRAGPVKPVARCQVMIGSAEDTDEQDWPDNSRNKYLDRLRQAQAEQAKELVELCTSSREPADEVGGGGAGDDQSDQDLVQLAEEVAGDALSTITHSPILTQHCPPVLTGNNPQTSQHSTTTDTSVATTVAHNTGAVSSAASSIMGSPAGFQTFRLIPIDDPGKVPKMSLVAKLKGTTAADQPGSAAAFSAADERLRKLNERLTCQSQSAGYLVQNREQRRVLLVVPQQHPPPAAAVVTDKDGFKMPPLPARFQGQPRRFPGVNRAAILGSGRSIHRKKHKSAPLGKKSRFPSGRGFESWDDLQHEKRHDGSRFCVAIPLPKPVLPKPADDDVEDGTGTQGQRNGDEQLLSRPGGRSEDGPAEQSKTTDQSSSPSPQTPVSVHRVRDTGSGRPATPDMASADSPVTPARTLVIDESSPLVRTTGSGSSVSSQDAATPSPEIGTTQPQWQGSTPAAAAAAAAAEESPNSLKKKQLLESTAADRLVFEMPDTSLTSSDQSGQVTVEPREECSHDDVHATPPESESPPSLNELSSSPDPAAEAPSEGGASEEVTEDGSDVDLYESDVDVTGLSFMESDTSLLESVDASIAAAAGEQLTSPGLSPDTTPRRSQRLDNLPDILVSHSPRKPTDQTVQVTCPAEGSGGDVSQISPIYDASSPDEYYRMLRMKYSPAEAEASSSRRAQPETSGSRVHIAAAGSSQSRDRRKRKSLEKMDVGRFLSRLHGSHK